MRSRTLTRYRSTMDYHWIRAAAIGVVAGFLSGLLGLGGGVIVAPSLALLVGLSQYSASATSVATIVASSGAALLAFTGGGNVDWVTAGTVFIGASIGAWAGARWMHKLPEHVLAVLLSVIMTIAAVRMWF